MSAADRKSLPEQAIPASDLLLGLYRRALSDSQHAFRELIERNADGLLVLRSGGEICFANPAAEALLGVSRHQLIGRKFECEVVPGETAVLEILRDRAANVPDVCVAELRSAEIVWEGAPALLTSLRDITARQRTEEALRFLSEASRELAGSLDEPTTVASVCRLAVGHLGDGCVIELTDEEGTLRPAAAAHRREEDQQQLREAVKLPAPAEVDSPSVGALASGEPVVYPPLPDRPLPTVLAERPPWCGAVSVRSYLTLPLIAQGRPLGVLTVLRGPGQRRPDAADLLLAEDFARRAAAAIDNARLYWKAQEENRRKAEFLAMLGHELRNPLGAMRNALAVYQATAGRGGCPEVRARPAEVMVRQVAHMSRLVDDLLEVARLTRGLIRLRHDRVDLKAVIADAVVSCRLLIVERNLRLYQELPDGPLPVTGDATRLEQVLVNLLHNAAKYTDPGGAITLRALIESGMVLVSVADTGVGIPAELMPRLFELFAAGPQTLDRSHGGLGLGLTLVKQLVELHGGTVSAESEGKGRGSVFSVRLPAALAEPHGPATPAAADTPAADTARRRILLVEDIADNREMLATLLEHWGHEVLTAGDGEIALRLALEARPEVVLMDIGLPGLNGYQVATRLRESQSEADGWRPLVVAMTGYGDPADRRRALQAGFDLHLTKPVGLDVLERLLTTMERPASLCQCGRGEEVTSRP